MAWMKVQKDLVSKVGGVFIGKSGLYDVIVKAVTVDVNDKGARTVGFFVELGGNTQMLYGALPLDLNDNSAEIESNVKTLQQFAVIADVEDMDLEDAILPIGKGGADKEIQIIQGMEDIECKLWVKQEFRKGKDGNIYESRIIKGAFTPDGASADEIVNETEYGVRLAKSEKYFTDIKYKDVTPEEVEEWIAADRPRSTGASNSPKKTLAPKFNKKFG